MFITYISNESTCLLPTLVMKVCLILHKNKICKNDNDNEIKI